MDKYTSAVIAFLETHRAVRKVQFAARNPIIKGAIISWNARNHPYRLPLDLQAFLQVSNGFALQWSANLNDAAVHLGNMNLNTIETIVKVEMDHWPEDDADNAPVVGKGKPHRSRKHKLAAGSAAKAPVTALKDVRAAFDLDSSCTGGRVALLYTQPDSSPEVWFQDLGCSWNFVASSFSDYFRLMLSHLGLPNWQYAFTPIGLEPSTLAWLHLLSPGRFEIDTRPHKKDSAKPGRRSVSSAGGRAQGDSVGRKRLSASGGRLTSLQDDNEFYDDDVRKPSASTHRVRPSTAHARSSSGGLAWKRG